MYKIFAMCGPYFTCYSYGALIRNKQQVWWGKELPNLDNNICVGGRSQLGESCVYNKDSDTTFMLQK